MGYTAFHESHRHDLVANAVIFDIYLVFNLCIKNQKDHVMNIAVSMHKYQLCTFFLTLNNSTITFTTVCDSQQQWSTGNELGLTFVELCIFQFLGN